MTRKAIQAQVGMRKIVFPNEYCPKKGCLWRTGGGYCPRHQPKEAHVTSNTRT